MYVTPFFAWTPSFPELAILLVVVVFLFGAKRLPELSRSVGKSISEFKKGKEEAERELEAGRTSAESEAAKQKEKESVKSE
ncbi:MAG: twin-arginine translocase TatA/TatE family subunit [Verrucomicrobia bacterium]|nr:twin-arginine translocase TatA/TatE family subunit [Verrucomicrobiota bacterium]MCH8512858.1 twin-arginine translocase TatA/TatE family subunit [Kiritimatiellia bacterium]